MPDDLPPAPSESDDASKAETIRITLPAKPETPTAKRETVRINLPGKSAAVPIPPAGITPKKETTKLSSGGGLTPPVAPTSSGARPLPPAPPRPPSVPGAPLPPAKPMSGVVPPPKPPALGKPTVPLKPAPPGSAPGAPAAPGAPKPPAPPLKPGAAPAAAAAPEPVTQKAAAPKKETARITLPPEAGKGAMPKATVKMQQTQPLRQPGASAIQTAPALHTAPVTTLSPAPASDGMLTILSLAALIIALGAAALSFLAYNASLTS